MTITMMEAMMTEKYNGWTNYATWRVRLEMFDGDFASDNDLDAYDLGQDLRNMAFDMISGEASGLAQDYAEAFLNDVNWYQIAERMIEDYRKHEPECPAVDGFGCRCEEVEA